MKKTIEIEAGGYYLFESMSTARSCYFESENEAKRFRILFRRYLGAYVEIHKMYLSSEGYQILLRVRGKAVLKRVYNDSCKKKGHEPNKLFLEEGWRIVSEQIRIFHSVYAKWVNGERDRTGGLVKERYSRYYFDSEESYNEYVSKMERGERILGQRNNRYRVSERWVELVNWGFIRSVGWVEKYMDAGFRNYVVGNLLKITLNSHSPPPNT